MQHDGTLNLAVGMSVGTKIWKNTKIKWSDLIARLKQAVVTNETYREFISATKDEQSNIKDVGGYVGGYLRNGRRKPEHVVYRQLLTLDIDYAHLDFWDDFCMQFSNAAVLHATHKHCDKSPRFRLIMPLSREASPDEYVAVSRRIAGLLNIELFDNTTFETNRLMFWPSVPKDVLYYFEEQEGPWVDVDEILTTYNDWTDSSLWPTADRKLQEVRDASKKQEDPETKKGIIGAFCRTYSMTEVIEQFLAEVYSPAGDGRYTYIKGTAAAGLIVYDDKFAYSHHGTDPAGGKLCNAFDLIRIHKFGSLDATDDQGPTNKLKSFKAMEDFITKDKNVKRTIASENISDSKYDFAEVIEEPQTEEYLKWTEELEVDSKGSYLSSAINLNLIFANDSRLKGLFRQNNFDCKRYAFGNLPWRKIQGPEPIKNVDYSGIRNYIETIYGIAGTLKIDDAMALEFEKRSFHPILNYLKALEWDQTKRIDTLLIKAFNTVDTNYTREAIRKTLVGAVARVFNPGVKFDLVLVLVGSQGTGKSTIFKKLGQQWFSDSFITVSGKEAFEQIQGAWIIEIAELAGLRKAEVEAVKHFISKQEDTFRPAYGRTAETYPRQCVFVGTTNNKDFLRDPSGNRRFMPVDVCDTKLVDNIFLTKELTKEYIDQLWAEAVYLYKNGEPLYLSRDAEALAETEQKKHHEADERKGIVDGYLDILLPEKWENMDIYERRNFLADPLSRKGTVERDYVCIAEIWCECLGKDKNDMDRYKTRDINEMMKGLDNWEQSKSTKNFKIYGKQKYYSRKLD
jgi:predicted P-loop ATPase